MSFFSVNLNHRIPPFASLKSCACFGFVTAWELWKQTVLFFQPLFFFLPKFMKSSCWWLGFQSGSEHMLQSLYLMWKAKHHKSEKRSSVFSDGSLNHSEDGKADTFLLWVAEWKLSSFRFFWLLPHSSSRSKTVCEGDIQPLCLFCSCVWLHASWVRHTSSSMIHSSVSSTHLKCKWLLKGHFHPEYIPYILKYLHPVCQMRSKIVTIQWGSGLHVLIHNPSQLM